MNDWQLVIDNFISTMDLSIPYEMQIMNAERDSWLYKWPAEVKIQMIEEIYEIYVVLKLNAKYI